mmetsp:Transcript_14507/g.32049  ORF Transcript_14507/g.32049 Transcript_14507/m.32049 type:complete len:206 (-) Transcript_14507:1030-1647(-)
MLCWGQPSIRPRAIRQAATNMWTGHGSEGATSLPQPKSAAVESKAPTTTAPSTAWATGKAATSTAPPAASSSRQARSESTLPHLSHHLQHLPHVFWMRLGQKLLLLLLPLLLEMSQLHEVQGFLGDVPRGNEGICTCTSEEVVWPSDPRGEVFAVVGPELLDRKLLLAKLLQQPKHASHLLFGMFGHLELLSPTGCKIVAFSKHR